ncbi:hypothetical protein ABK040_012567 [Willaertia magna]
MSSSINNNNTKSIDPRLEELLKETGTNLSTDELEALRYVSVKELIALWESLGKLQEQLPLNKYTRKKITTKKDVFDEWTKNIVKKYKEAEQEKLEKERKRKEEEEERKRKEEEEELKRKLDELKRQEEEKNNPPLPIVEGRRNCSITFRR